MEHNQLIELQENKEREAEEFRKAKIVNNQLI